MIVDKYLNSLEKTWDYTQEELNDIKEKMISYASDATMDSEVRREIEEYYRNKYKST